MDGTYKVWELTLRDLARDQQQLLERLVATGKPVVVVRGGDGPTEATCNTTEKKRVKLFLSAAK